MNRTRALIPVLASLASLVLVAGAVAGTGPGSGGTGAPPLVETRDGGMLAPGPVVKGDGGTGAVRAVPSQEPTPTVPEGEQQPDTEEPSGGDEPTSDDDPAGDDGTAPPGDEAPPAGDQEPAAEDTGSGSAIGFLPSTGLELAALAAVGLGLTLAGMAIRPRRPQLRP